MGQEFVDIGAQYIILYRITLHRILGSDNIFFTLVWFIANILLIYKVVFLKSNFPSTIINIGQFNRMYVYHIYRCMVGGAVPRVIAYHAGSASYLMIVHAVVAAYV